MTIQECYLAMGGNYEAISGRLPSPRLIDKFVRKFLDDLSFEQLCEHMDAGNRAEAFRAAHTLKGVCANLGFDALLGVVEPLTELLRPEVSEIPAGADALLKDVCREYDRTVAAIHAYVAEA